MCTRSHAQSLCCCRLTGCQTGARALRPARPCYRPSVRTLSCALLCATLCGWLAAPASSRPEGIRAGDSYYSEEFVARGIVRDIAKPGNLEEVRRHPSYYEAIYDEAGRVVVFREYHRGEVARTEEYRYGPDGALRGRTLRVPGRPTQTIAVDGTGTGGRSGD